MEQAEYSRVRELIDRIEDHPHRDEWQADSMQDNVYNPFSANSKKMIHDTGQRGVLRILRGHFKSAMLLLSILLGKTALYTVLVEIACVTQNSRVSWIEIDFDAQPISN